MATDSELIGRDSVLARLRGLVDPPPAESRVLVLLGEAGMGKSVLLADAARRARAAVVAASGAAADPHGYGQAVAGELFPDVLPYVVGTPATYGFAGRNGRPLADNAPEVMLSLVTGTAVPSGLKPSVAGHLRDSSFPYVVPA